MWREFASIPSLPSDKPVSAGGWLVYARPEGQLFVAKGNKTQDFYRYDRPLQMWSPVEPIPLGSEQKPAGAGCSGISDDAGSIYMAKGNSSLGFWRYDIGRDSWFQLPDVPAGVPDKNAKGGTDIVYATQRDTGCVFLLKGGTCQFLAYNTLSRTWRRLPDAPLGAGKTYGKGSWILSDGAGAIYAHKAKYQEFYRYNLHGDSWESRALNPMPTIGRLGKRRKSGDGGSAVWMDRSVFALKGGSTQEFWRYFPARDSWVELETLPCHGSSGRVRKVKSGGSVASDAGYDTSYVYYVLFALKGNKINEVWQKPWESYPVDGGAQTTATLRYTSPLPRFRVRPSLVSGQVAYIDYHLEQPGWAVIQVSDAAGRIRLTCRFRANAIGLFCLHMPELPPGTYLVTLKSGGKSRTQKLVVHH